MLKGVNRQVVEIAHPESVYFEKVLFFVKPEFSRVSESKIKDKADELIREAADPPVGKNRFKEKGRMKQFLKLAAAAAMGAAAAGIFAVII